MTAYIPEFSLLLLYHKYPFDLLPLLPHAYTSPYFSNDEERDIQEKAQWIQLVSNPRYCPQTTRIKIIKYQSDNTHRRISPCIWRCCLQVMKHRIRSMQDYCFPTGELNTTMPNIGCCRYLKLFLQSGRHILFIWYIACIRRSLIEPRTTPNFRRAFLPIYRWPLPSKNVHIIPSTICCNQCFWGYFSYKEKDLHNCIKYTYYPLRPITHNHLGQLNINLSLH